MTVPSPIPDDVRLARHLEQAATLLTSLEPRAALGEAAAALRIAREQQNTRAIVEALATATLAHYYRGDYVATVASGLDAAAAATAGDGDVAGGAMAMYGVALAFTAVQDFARAEAAAHRAIELASLANDLRREGSAHSVLGAALAEARQTEPAVAAFRRAARRFRQLQDLPRLKRTLFNSGVIIMRSGIALSRDGDQTAARRAWRRALRYYSLARATGQSRQDDINITAAQGECNMLLGHLTAARELTMRAAANSERDDLPVVAGYLTYVRGEIARQQGRHALAAKYLTKALKLLDRTQFDHGPADCRTALANLAEDRGAHMEAAHWRAEALRLADGRQASLAEFRQQVMPMWERYLERRTVPSEVP